MQFPLAMRILGNRDDAVVAYPFALRLLQRLQDANELATNDQTGLGRGIMNDHRIERIAILGSSRRNETPVIRIG
jgi:hypothetical protein